MRGPLTYLYCCSYEGENVHDPNPIDVAAQASGEPTFREVGVGPWSQTHPGEPRPDDASSPNYDIRFDSTLLDEGDRRNVLDRYRYWTVAAAATDGTSGTAPNTGETMAQLEALDAKIAELQAARVIALDIIPGAVPMETYHFPEHCLMLFGAEGPGLSEKALELADDVVYISQFGSVRSINAGAAAAVSMHAWIAQHAAPQA